MVGHARVHALVVGVGRVEEAHAIVAHHLHRLEDVGGRERDVLNALAVIDVEIFLDLRLLVRGLVDRDADLAARARHRARREPRLLALDVEVADLAKVEELLVEVRPHVHAARVDVVREVVDLDEPRALGISLRALDGDEVDAVDRELAVIAGVAIDQVDDASADPLDRGDVELHRPDRAVEGLGAELDRTAVGLGRVPDLI